ncbi:MAG: Asp-tRNA(Asn)/Glu-tRNA(Gln) amidotransferase subunit GatA [bacterium]|nr:Asp-tRNA(Asn)/Glu-tRNA(Gln) amidotransferase subunit GatA [bacterium]
MSRLSARTLSSLSASLESGELSSREIVADCLERIESSDDLLGAFSEVRAEAALRAADEADRERSAGEVRSALHGLPIAIKGILASPEFETTCGSRILKGFRAPYEATVLRKLREAGMIVVGSTNMDEFAMGSSCENSAYGPTRNPWNTDCVPGGSSGGSAAAVAARQVPATLGSDTGGSIRQPAALCGVVGIKPTYGRVSRYGLVAFASSLDQIGTFSHSVEDSALLLETICGHDPKDATSVPREVPRFSAGLDGSVEGLRIGIPEELFSEEGIDPEVLLKVREAVSTLESMGAKTVPVSLPHSEFGIATYYLICTAEASSNLSRYDGVKFGFRAESDQLDEMYRRTRSEGFGAEVKRRIILGTYVLSAGYYDAYYRKAQQVRTLIRRDFARAFEVCDVLASPATPGPAWPLGERTADPLQMYMSDIFTVTLNLAGLPGIALPCGFTASGLPVGFQLLGRALDEQTLLRIGDAFQRQTDWHKAVPSGDSE